MFEIYVENVQAIREFTVKTEGNTGGVLVVKGDNGVGKSTFIALLRGMLTGAGKFSPTDGAKRGKVEAFGRELSVTSQNRFKGECDVPALEGKYDFSDFVFPMFKTREIRDSARVRALITLNNVVADQRLFYPMLGGEETFKELIPASALETDDLTVMADRIRRALHGHAHQRDEQAKHSRASAKACEDIAKDVDITKVIDMAALHDASQEAAAAHAKLVEQAEAALRSQTAVEQQQKRLDKVISEYSGPAVDEAADKLQSAEDELEGNIAVIASLKARLLEAERKGATLLEATLAQKKVLEAATSHFAAVESLQATIGQAKDVPSPKAEEVAAALEVKKVAAEEVEKASVLRSAQEKAKEGAGHREKARKLEKECDQFRDMAGQVDEILTNALPPGPLKWKGGGLVLETERGPETLFDEVSNGEKWRVALPYGIKAVGPGGVLPVVQDAWQDLGTKLKLEISEMCREAKVWVITAQVTDGELRAEVFNPEAAEVVTGA